nr:uncharacterized protein LOC117690934 [Crassostrea gigas]
MDWNGMMMMMSDSNFRNNTENSSTSEDLSYTKPFIVLKWKNRIYFGEFCASSWQIHAALQILNTCVARKLLRIFTAVVLDTVGTLPLDIVSNVFMVTQEQNVQLHVLIRYLEKIVKAFVTVQFRSVTSCLGAITIKKQPIQYRI